MQQRFTLYKPAIFRILVLMAAICCMTPALLAGPGQSPVIQVLDGSQGQLAKDSFNIVSDTMFFDPAFNAALVKPYLVRNTITFRIDPYSKYALQGNFTATVKLELTRTAADGSTSVLDTALTVRYTTDSLVTDGDRYLFSNSYSVKVKVLDRSSNVSWDVWKCLKLENELQSFPVFAFHCDTDTILSLAHTALDSATRADELPVTWSAVMGADQYDLEWTYIDSSALKNPLHLFGNPGPDPARVFDNNSSRVTITGTAYNIPIFYDGTGTLFFRVRPVQLQAGGGRTEGHWSSDHAPAGSFYFKGHQRNLNWQATSSYAEEGKRKVVLQYYDGSLRGRQTVTKDNSTNTTIVAESYYDYQGRPTVQVLPAPTFSNVIQYSRNFNLGMNGAYDKNDFDSLSDASDYCSSGASPMPTDSGASLYYSPSNPEKDSGFNKYIPDAKGFPFTQVEYVQDNTGRISRQSGVGPDHRLGSGHETKYYYGTPDQRELDALFGTEVGDHSHYFKTMVRDANGQYSVSYTDMHGRTIATALAGAPPDSIRLDTLGSYRAQNVTETLSDAGSNTVHDLVMESKKGLLVSVGGENLFQYKLDPASLQLPDCNNRTVCYDCLYDLEITMTDDCNNQKLGGHAFDTVFHNFSLSGPIDTSCSNNAGSFAVSFSKYLEEGSYEITKRLSVSQYGESYYRDSVYMKRNMCRTMNAFLQDQRDIQASITQCQPTCQSCTDSLGTFAAYYQRFVTRAGIATGDTSYDAMIRTAYQQAQDDCRALCDLANQQDDILHAMLLDLTPPSGQYANATNPEDVNSIFYLKPLGSDGDSIANYQRATNYVDDNGQPDLVYDEASGTSLTPQNLTPQVFSDKFKLSWAQSLLQYHPEYQKLVAYQALAQSPAWDKRFEAVSAYSEALAKGYLNPTHNVTSPFSRYAAMGSADYDPLAITYSNSTNKYTDSLEYHLTHFMQKVAHPATASDWLTLWEYATASIKCAGKDKTCFSGYVTDDSAFATSACTGDLDMAWRTFRQAYLDIKQGVINSKLKTITPTAATLLAAGHQPHFTDAGEVVEASNLNPPSDTAAARAQAQAALNGYYDSTCRAYVTMWWQDLKLCNYNSTDSAAIIPLLIQVCKEGSDGNHPYGASSVAPTSGNQYHSFEDVINAYNQSKGISSSANCNAYGITAPAPYDQQVIYSNKPLWTRPSDCECTQIQSLYANYQATIGHYSSFSDYLHKAYQTDISDADLTTLMNLCRTDPAVAGCSYLAAPIQLPPALQCDAGDICVGSTKFKSLDSMFRSEFPRVLPVANPNPEDSVQVSADKLYENFMNAHLGFGKTSTEYLTFLAQANGGGGASPVTYDTTTISCARLDSLLSEYKRSYVQPATGYVDLDMRTFAGNITPQEGPKGVFDVTGQFIANTVDGTPDQINASYAQIWNNDFINAHVGTLTALSNGKFHLQLRPGATVPKDGIIGMRYYQFNAKVKDTLSGYPHFFWVGVGSYVSFGDGTFVRADSSYDNHISTVFEGDSMTYSYEEKPILGVDYHPVKRMFIGHIYAHNDVPTSHTITVYHTDIEGCVAFLDFGQQSDTNVFSEMKGYWPQQTYDLKFLGTRDSTINRTDSIRNFSQINSIEDMEFYSEGAALTHANFGNFSANHNMRRILWIPSYNFLPGYDTTNIVDSLVGKHFYEMFPNLPQSFPELRYLMVDALARREQDLLHLNLSLPKLKYVEFGWQDPAAGFIDTVYNQLARVTTVNGGGMLYFGWPNPAILPGAASTTARNYLLSRGWHLSDGISSDLLADSPSDLGNTDAFPSTNNFADFVNSKFGTSMSWDQVSQLYVGKCGSAPVYWTPDSLAAGVTPANCSGAGYVQTFTANGSEKTDDLTQMSDAGHLSAGHFNPGGASNQDAFIAKTDKNGNVQWYKAYGGTGTDDLVKIRSTADGGFVSVGNSSSFGTGKSLIWVIKGDASGNVQWSRTLDAGSTNGEVAVDIIQTADGHYAIAANYDNTPSTVYWEVIFLYSDGTTLWTKKLGTYPAENSGGLAEDSGSLLFSGLFTRSSEYDGMIVKLNEDFGTVAWNKGYDIDNRSNWFRGIYNIPGGYLINSLTTNSFTQSSGSYGDMQQTILQTDKNGHTTSVRIFDHPGSDAGQIGLTPNPAGGYTTIQGESAGNADLYITRTNSNGSVTSTNRIVLNGDQRTNGFVRNADGSVEVGGYSDNSALLARMDSLGKSGCHDSTVTISSEVPFIREYDTTLMESALAIDNNQVTLTPTVKTTTNSFLCVNTPCSAASGPVKDSLFLCGRAAPVFSPVSLNTVTNCSDSSFFEVSKSTELFNVYSDSLHGKFDSSYRAKCMQAYLYESFTVTHIQSEYHYTLYYYDQAGNLLKTVPPAGVNANYDSLWLNSVAAARLAGGSLVPTHGLLTQYRYNTLNQVMAQQTTDAGRSYFWYDRLGRLAISQNARQRSVVSGEQGRQYSYTLYDYIGRITEVGQINNAGTVAMTDSISRSESLLTAWITASAAGKEQITQTVYDLAYPGFTGVPFVPVVQRNLRNRVSYTSYTSGGNLAQYDQGTFYTYDIEGNVDTLLQDYGSSTTGVANIMNKNGNRFKRLVYQYDLVSGKVNSVAYQPHQVDAFYHRYSYDAENRLILAETSQDSVYWDKDARYDYYRHGPLARETIGDMQVQGLDYAYTLQGWLKGVNSTSLSPVYDMGADGDTSHQNRYIARDAYGYSLNYYTGDYTAIGTGVMPFPGSSGYLNAAYRPLFNGNISSMAVNLGPLYRTRGSVTDNSHWRGPMLYNYSYDQLNRITGLDAFYGLNQATNSWSGLQPTADFRERVSYDGNGNIQRYVRNNFGETGLPMDSLGYKYLTGTNQLEHIVDSASDAVGGGYDLHNQPAGNYKYDSIGNLIRDSSEKISSITWNVYGKITEIDHSTTSAARPTKNIYYYYDAAGNRVGKKTTRGDNATASYTWYVRDASGNVMATYTAGLDSSKVLDSADLHIGEKHIYGSSRLGIVNADYSTDANTDGLSIYTSPWTGAHLPYYTGQKQYELVNHLGNVLATITDKKIGLSLSSDSSLIDHYEADVRTAQDYYPFGMVMPGRMFTAISIPGGAVSGQSQVNGYTLPVDLDLTARGDDQTTEYVATQMIDLDNGFESGDVEDVTLYIADTSYAGTGNGLGAELAGGGKYRYGFNGKENDNEVEGVGNQVDYGMRVYDPRIGKFLSVDPLQKKYPYYTPYQYAGNTPVWATDLDGKEPAPFEMHMAHEAISKYEGDLRKSDPEHAEQIIFEQNKNAFLFTGSALSAGSGVLFQAFTDGILLYGAYKTTSGIVRNDAETVKDGMNTMAAGMLGDLGGAALGTLFKFISTRASIPLFRGTTEGFAGNPSLQRLGISPTSTDPAIATIFATESEQSGSGVLYLTNTSKFTKEGVSSNVLSDLEKEIAVNVSPAKFPEYASQSITSAQARNILKEMGINVPSKITKSNISTVISQTRNLTKSEIQTFIKKASDLAAKKK